MQNNNKETWRLILASQSPRRKELLGRTNVPFDIIVSHVDEVSDAKDPRDFALEIALLKGKDIHSKHPGPQQMIICCDTVVALGEKIFGKPRSIQEARDFLLQLSGKVHTVHTGLAIITPSHTYSHVETTEVEFAPIAPRLLDNYLATPDSLDKAGAYGIQGQALTFISRINGCYSSVVGFPLAQFCDMMENQVRLRQGWDSPWQNYFS